MAAAIITASTHHGNTRKLVDAIKDRFDIETIDATVSQDIDLSGYDLIGFASGIYAEKFHKSVLDIASKKLPDGKKIFFMCTSAMGKDYTKSIRKAVEGKNIEIMGAYFCKGYNTFGPFKLIGGTGKGHPDEKDIQGAVDFYQGLVNRI